MAAVSICIPTYEPKPEHLRTAVESALSQTFTDWELLIHDDASEQSVGDVVRPYLKDPRVTFHRSDERLGIGGNWNATMRKGTAPLVAYLFQDDLWEPSYLARSLDVLNRHPDVGFVAAEHTYLMESTTSAAATGIYDEVRRVRREYLHGGRIDRHAFLKEWIASGLRPNIIGEPSFVVLRRALMRDIGPFREDMKQGLDAEYWMRCLLMSDGYWIEENLGAFRVHAAAATACNEESGAGALDRLKIFRGLIKALPQGELRTLARKRCRGEMLGMVGKFMKRRML